MDIALMVNGRTMTMAEYPQREYIVRETEYPLGCTKKEEVCELVRCKDCIRFFPDDDVWGWCTVSGKMRCKDYCSYGVREDGDDAEGTIQKERS